MPTAGRHLLAWFCLALASCSSSPPNSAEALLDAWMDAAKKDTPERLIKIVVTKPWVAAVCGGPTLWEGGDREEWAAQRHAAMRRAQAKLAPCTLRHVEATKPEARQDRGLACNVQLRQSRIRARYLCRDGSRHELEMTAIIGGERWGVAEVSGDLLSPPAGDVVDRAPGLESDRAWERVGTYGGRGRGSLLLAVADDGKAAAVAVAGGEPVVLYTHPWGAPHGLRGASWSRGTYHASTGAIGIGGGQVVLSTSNPWVHRWDLTAKGPATLLSEGLVSDVQVAVSQAGRLAIFDDGRTSTPPFRAAPKLHVVDGPSRVTIDVDDVARGGALPAISPSGEWIALASSWWPAGWPAEQVKRDLARNTRRFGALAWYPGSGQRAIVAEVVGPVSISSSGLLVGYAPRSGAVVGHQAGEEGPAFSVPVDRVPDAVCAERAVVVTRAAGREDWKLVIKGRDGSARRYAVPSLADFEAVALSPDCTKLLAATRGMAGQDVWLLAL